MTIHLIKLCVGIEDIDHLARVQDKRLATEGQLRHVTRQRPRREDDLLDGGSLYWVIKGAIRVRQRILGLDDVIGADGIKRCAVLLDPERVETQSQPFRAFQGWRYLEPVKAPADASARNQENALPPHLERDLKEAGLL